ncbi:glycosyltransferase family protein [Vacuolonema iberomarrocanum]|uniref:glycosyltransferase family protein n=1 Tax=Vacuolonema iberomarrocanum TaxID=3454632 RepID=UPI001A04D349|nr:glycosyltransferase [filamentous cyanobacterium LEGE 07170]
MRLALHNPFEETWFAESELARRIGLAAARLDWVAVECRNPQEIRAMQPDCVLALHNNAPKATEFPTYGCMWNPPIFFEGVEAAIANILSYDGYLVSSSAIACWLHRLLSNTPKPFLQAPFYTSSPRSEFRAPNLEEPQLFYCGSNWDGQRFQDLFQRLDARPYMAVYGNPKGWGYLKTSYRGALPFDGTSVLETLHQRGVGLCLHRPEHRDAAIPTMRIFEIVASGAIALCSDHPFIYKAFGDSVLYIDAEATAEVQVQQIDAHMDWIRNHPEAAIALAQQAHNHFTEHYALEILLKNIATLHQTALTKKHFVSSGHLQIEVELPVQMVLLGGHHSAEAIGRSLQSLSQQTYPNLSVLLVQTEQESEQPEWHDADVSLTHLTIPADAPISTALWEGLATTHGDYVGVLDAGTVLHPNHISTLCQSLQRDPNCGVAYSGMLQAQADTTVLQGFQPFNLNQLLQFKPPLASGSFLMRRKGLMDRLNRDPYLNATAILCLLLHLAQTQCFRFSYEVTGELPAQSDNSANSQPEDVEAEYIALRLIFWHQEFASGKTLQSAQSLSGEPTQLSRTLSDAQARIAAMESSKFWKLRTQWIQLKRRLGISTTD